MPDMMTPSPTDGGEENEVQVREVNPLGRGRAGKWFENFWYHYKFPTIAAVFLIVVIIVCAVQCASKPKDPTFNICYAGSLNIGTAMSGDIATQHAMRDTILPAVSVIAEEDDTAKAGELISIFGYLIDDDSEYEAVRANSPEGKNNLRAELDTANTFIFLIAEDVYDVYAFSPSDRNSSYMVYLKDNTKFLPAGNTSLELTSDGYGVYLRSTPLADMAGFCDLPEDTILCLRTSFSLFRPDTKKNADIYAQNEDLFRFMLNGAL